MNYQNKITENKKLKKINYFYNFVSFLKIVKNYQNAIKKYLYQFT